MVSPEVAGRTMVAIGAVGVLVALVATVVASRLAGDVFGGADRTIELTADLLVTVDDSFAVAEEALLIVIDGTQDAAAAVHALGRSLEQGGQALEGARELTGGEIADALDEVDQVLPAVQQAAAAIERTLEALDQLPLGLDYSPARSLADSVGELQEGLDGLPEQLRDQAEQIEGTTVSLEEATARTLATGDALDELGERLEEASVLVGTYADGTAEARALVEEQRDSVAANVVQTRVLIIVVGLMVALSQFVPLYLGWLLVTGRWLPVARRGEWLDG